MGTGLTTSVGSPYVRWKTKKKHTKPRQTHARSSAGIFGALTGDNPPSVEWRSIEQKQALPRLQPWNVWKKNQAMRFRKGNDPSTHNQYEIPRCWLLSSYPEQPPHKSNSRETEEPLYCKTHRVTHVEKISVFYKNPHSTSQTQFKICTFPIHKQHVHVYTHTLYIRAVSTDQ